VWRGVTSTKRKSTTTTTYYDYDYYYYYYYWITFRRSGAVSLGDGESQLIHDYFDVKSGGLIGRY